MRAILILLLCCCGGFASGQGSGSYSFQLGLGKGTAYTSHLTPEAEVAGMLRLSRSIYAGGAITYQRYSFVDGQVHGSVIDIHQKSSYIYFSPKIDLGIGFRKRVHMHLGLGPGLFVGGSKWTDNYENFYSPVTNLPVTDTVSRTATATMRNVLFRYAYGLTYRFPVGFWSIILTAEYSYIPSHLNYPGIDLQTNYFAIMVGIMHKYPQVRRDDD